MSMLPVAALDGPFAPPSDRPPGLCVALEGPDGCGKSTLIPTLADALQERTGRVVRVLREPGGTTAGEAIRDILLSSGPERVPLDGLTSLLLFSASRRHLLTQVVAPALAEGQIVLLDRFALSTYVYQGEQGVEASTIEAVTSMAVGERWPDRTLVLDIDAETLEQRRLARLRGQLATGQVRSEAVDQFEAHQGARAAERIDRYRAAAARLPNVTRIDARGTPDRTLQHALEALQPLVAGLDQPTRVRATTSGARRDEGRPETTGARRGGR